MNLYIKIENNAPVGHPLLQSNMFHNFGRFGPDNIPDGYMRFYRVDRPAPTSVYEFVSQNPNYVIRDGAVYDEWEVRDMTAAEKTEKQNDVKAQWASLTNAPASWTFNETTCEYEPPVAYPDDFWESGTAYRWNEETQTWDNEV